MKWVGILACFCLVSAVEGSGSRCRSAGGRCQDNSAACSGGYQSGLCPGAWNIRCCMPSQGGSGDYNCYGNFMNLHPTGASAKTARQDRLSREGVWASERMVTEDFKRLNKLKDCYVQAGVNNCVHPAVIAAIASRETRGGSIIARTDGWGDHGRAYGIMQCDGRASGLGSRCIDHPWDSCQHIDMMVTTLLVPFIKSVQSKHPDWAPEWQLQGGVAAYNVGVGNVRTFSRMDLGTTGNDYSNDVMARAQYLVSNFGW